MISVVSLRMLKWDAIQGYKTMRATQKTFFGASKDVIIELRPMDEERHHLMGLKDERTSKNTPEMASKKKVVEPFTITLS